jgi:hypothetical protein
MTAHKGRRVFRSVYLDPIKMDALKRLSVGTGRPMAEHLREGLDMVLKKYHVDIPLPSVPCAKSAQGTKKKGADKLTC